ncbi:MAG TPA: transglycosylase domain-containing protein [Acidimicrobiales bacterium]|nr:transglycosylase domain-containing protein [Acidimicrobiales bacterium]
MRFAGGRQGRAPDGEAGGAAARATRRSWLWRYRRLLYLVALLGFTAVSGIAFVLAQAPLPAPRRLAETTIITDLGGQRLASIDSGENRVPVPLDQVPQVVVDAVLATEDRNFYRHGGLDPAGIARALVADLRGRPLQGGSTITQQYVKNAFLSSRERTVSRKLREAALAVKLERRFDKPQILERYLNTVYFGRGAYGVQAASRAYFGKDVNELGLDQGAYLAGLIRAPETADAFGQPDRAVARRDLTLGAMREAGMIDEGELRAARKVDLRTLVLEVDKREPDVVRFDKGTGYFVDHVLREVVRRYGEEMAFRGGLRVRTTLDLALQEEAYDAVYKTLDREDDPAGALVSIDDQGRVRAMVGGRDFSVSKVNFAVGQAGGGSGRQAGSTFKPFVLAAALREGYTARSAFPAPASIVLPKADDGKDYPVENYEDADFGAPLDLIEATVHSANTVYVQAQLALGAEKAVDFAHQAGIVSELEPNASLVLGTEEVSVLELAAAYSTFANRGLRVEPRVILEVRRADGTLIERERPPVRQRVLDPAKADVVNHVLRQVVERGSGSAARIAAPVAGKTGTTQDFGDAWFVGYTPRLTTAVWMGYPEGNARKMTNVHGQRVNGGSLPARIFRRYMVEVAKDPALLGQFPVVSKFPGKVLAPPRGVVLPTTTTSTPPTTVAPPAAGDRPEDGDGRDKDKGKDDDKSSAAPTTVPGPAPPPEPSTG